MSTHTAGPWHVDDEGRTGDVSDIWIGTEGGGNSLARLGDDPGLTHAEHLTNAALMAASPDLLRLARIVAMLHRESIPVAIDYARRLLARIEKDTEDLIRVAVEDDAMPTGGAK